MRWLNNGEVKRIKQRINRISTPESYEYFEEYMCGSCGFYLGNSYGEEIADVCPSCNRIIDCEEVIE